MRRERVPREKEAYGGKGGSHYVEWRPVSATKPNSINANKKHFKKVRLTDSADRFLCLSLTSVRIYAPRFHEVIIF
uniref:Uncharacterized protein n=1 Tax=Cucumis melo TaxID=3656 RepID=A0A9I9EI44_CUCME